jgi:hypothetical protein
MTTEVLRKKVKGYVDHADKKSLLIVERILEKDHDEDWWDKLPEEVQLSVKKAIKDIDEGKGIPHEEVKKMYPQWFKR